MGTGGEQGKVRTALLVVAVGLLLTFGGCTLGVAVSAAYTSGALQTWSALPPPPSRARRIDDGGLGAIRIEAEDGTLYTYEVRTSGAAWRVAPPAPPREAPELERCPATTSYHVMDPPGRVVQRTCAEWSQHNEAGGRRDFVLLDDGRLYTWEHFDSGLLGIFMLAVGIVAGGGAGLVAAVIVGLRIVRRAREG